MVEYTRNKRPQKRPDDFVIGIQPISECIDSGKTVEKLLIRKGLRNDQFKDLFDKVRNLGIPFQFVPEPKLNSISRKNHQGVIAITSPVEYQQLDMLIPSLFENGETPCLLLLDGVTDVRNIGAIARSAECLGAHGIIIGEKNVAPLNSAAVKSSSGALLKVPVCKVKNLRSTVKYLADSGISAIACTEKGSDSIWETNFTIPHVIIMGAEDIGIAENILEICDSKTQIPMSGTIASLNVSVSAGVILNEVQRQRMTLNGE